ncbi:hypothetical protein, partial [Escherichia coli]
PVFHTIVSIKNDGHYFCGAGGNRPDGSDEALTLNLFIMQNGIAHNGLILLWRMREGKHLCPGKTTLSDHAVLYLPVSTFVGTGFFIHPL